MRIQFDHHIGTCSADVYESIRIDDPALREQITYQIEQRVEHGIPTGWFVGKVTCWIEGWPEVKGECSYPCMTFPSERAWLRSEEYREMCDEAQEDLNLKIVHLMALVDHVRVTGLQNGATLEMIEKSQYFVEADKVRRPAQPVCEPGKLAMVAIGYTAILSTVSALAAIWGAF